MKTKDILGKTQNENTREASMEAITTCLDEIPEGEASWDVISGILVGTAKEYIAAERGAP